MKKIVCTMLCVLLGFSMSACGGNVSEVNTHNVESEMYSEEDIRAAVNSGSSDHAFRYELIRLSRCN